MGEFKNTEAFVKKYGNEVISETQNRLVSAGKVASGRLFDSLRFEVKTNPDIVLTFKMADYGKYVDKGVSGAGIPEGFGGKKKKVEKGLYKFGSKMPPSIKGWMKIQGLPKKAEFAVRRSIWIFGIAPTNFFTIPTTRRKKQFEAGIEKAMGKDFEEILTKGFKKK